MMTVSVCLSANISMRPVFTKFLVHVTHVCGSVLRWRHCDTLLTSGFMDDIIFAHNGPYAGVSVNTETVSRMMQPGG